MSAVVEVRQLWKTFEDEARGRVEAVRSIDFECKAGEVFGLLGANGAGKTTTLRMLATVLRPTSGSVTVLGHDAGTEFRTALDEVHKIALLRLRAL